MTHVNTYVPYYDDEFGSLFDGFVMYWNTRVSADFTWLYIWNGSFPA
jgi:hypothetical protein